MIIAATGHRPDKLGGYGADVRAKLRKLAREYLGLSLATECISGMALGWDMAFAEAACQLGIPFTAAVPFEGQEARWPAESQARYHKLLSRANDIHVVSPPGYEVFKMYARNAWMADNADRLCALWDGSPGGTSHCVEYAQALGLPIDNVWGDFKS